MVIPFHTSDQNIQLEENFNSLLSHFGFNASGKRIRDVLKNNASDEDTKMKLEAIFNKTKHKQGKRHKKNKQKKVDKGKKQKKNSTNMDNRSKLEKKNIKENTDTNDNIQERIQEQNSGLRLDNEKEIQSEEPIHNDVVNSSEELNEFENTSIEQITTNPTKKGKKYKRILGPNFIFCERSKILQIRLSQRNLELPSLKDKLEDVIDGILSIENLPSPLRTIIELQENNLDDESIHYLCEFILAQNLNVTILKLWKNNFGDEAAESLSKLLLKMPIHELHLSHNKISSVGAKLIFDSVHESNLYPLHHSIVHKDGKSNSNMDGKPTPLWLRLEYNRIDPKECIEYLSTLKDNWCDADNRNKCGPFQCSKKKAPSIHLYCFTQQRQSPTKSSFLLLAQKEAELLKSRMNSKKERSDQSDLTSTSQDTVIVTSPINFDLKSDLSISQMFDLSKENINYKLKEDEYVDLHPNSICNQLPLYIFVDTCSVINMLSSKKQQPSRKVRPVHLFNFENLLLKNNHHEFGSFPDHKDNIQLIITDTTMQELDRVKNVDGHGIVAKMIRELTREGGTIHKATKHNFLVMLGAHEAEHLVRSEGKEFFAQSNQHVSNDTKLLQVALFWQEAIGVIGSVLILTDDYEMHRRAKQHNIPSELLSNLDDNLHGHETEVWTAQFIRSIIPHAFQNNIGENMLKHAPTKTQANSIYTEMEKAISLVEKWIQHSKNLDFQKGSASEDCKQITGLDQKHSLVMESEESLERWKQLLENLPSLLKN